MYNTLVKQLEMFQNSLMETTQYREKPNKKKEESLTSEEKEILEEKKKQQLLEKIALHEEGERNYKILRNEASPLFLRFQLFEQRNSVLDGLLDYIRTNENLQLDGNLTFEESYYRIKKQMLRKRPTFLAYQFLEFLSPGWKNDIGEGGKKKRKTKTRDKFGEKLKEKEKQMRAKEGRDILKTYRLFKKPIVDPHEKAELFLKYYIYENLIKPVPQTSYSTDLSTKKVEKGSRPSTITRQTSFESGLSVCSDENTQPLTEEIENIEFGPYTRFQFVELHERTRDNIGQRGTLISVIETTGRMLNIARVSGSDSLLRNVHNDILFKWRYMVKMGERDPRDLEDSVNLRELLKKNGDQNRNCISCPPFRVF